MLQGANGAIGEAASRLIAESIPGSHVILAGRDYAKVEAAANSIKNSDNIKGTISAVQLDITDSTSIEEAAKYVQEKFGRLDVLVNNAASGFTPGTTLHQIEQQVKVNTLGPAAVAEAFNPLLLKSSNPYSIFMSSAIGSLAMAKEFGGAIVNEMWTPHRISKSALNMFVIMEDKFQGPKGIKVFAMCPGLVKSAIRGPSPEAINAGGMAADPVVPAETLLSIIEGKRDADVGKFVHKDGIHPW